MIDRHISWVSWVSAIVGGIVFLVGIFFLFRVIQVRSEEKKHSLSEIALQQQLEQALAPLSLTAEGILIYDATSDTTLYQHHAHEILPIASITKIATAITALAYADPNDSTVLPYSVQTPLDPNVLLPAGKTYALKDMVRFMLATSSNDAATALANNTITILQNKNSKQVYFPVLATQTLLAKGISPWVVGTPNGLDAQYDPTVYASSWSVARALVYFVQTYPDIAAQLVPKDNYTLKTSDGIQYNFQHTLRYDGAIPSDMVFAKTGYTDEADGSLAFIIKHPQSDHMVVVVLLGLSKQMRLPEAAKIISTLNTISL